MNDDAIKKMKQALDMARKIIETTEIVVKILNDDKFNQLEKTYIIDTITSRTAHEIKMIQDEEYFKSFNFAKGGVVKGSAMDDTVIRLDNNEKIVKKETILDIEKVRAEIDRLTDGK